MKTKLFLIHFFFVQSLFSQGIIFNNVNSIGGDNADRAFDFVIDEEGNQYSTGYFAGTVDFDPGPADYILQSAGAGDIFITKFDASGNFVWARTIGGISHDVGHGIDVRDGYVYVTGEFEEVVNFDPLGSGVFLTSDVNYDFFVLKLDDNGNFEWVYGTGELYEDFGEKIVAGSDGSVYVAGRFRLSYDFDTGPGEHILSAGGEDIFILKLDANGSFVWARKLGGGQDEEIYDMEIDDEDKLYILGSFAWTGDYDPGPEEFFLIPSFNGSSNLSLTVLDSAGDFQWATKLGGDGGIVGKDLEFDSNYNLLLTGFFVGEIDFDPGIFLYNLDSPGARDAFILKLTNNGQFEWAKSFGHDGSNWDTECYGLDLDSQNNIYLTGSFENITDFDPGPESATVFVNGDEDAFLNKLDSLGNFIWATKIGGSEYDYGRDIHLDDDDDIYIMGDFREEVDFDFGANELILESLGNSDIFILKYSNCQSTSSTQNIVTCNSYTSSSGITYSTSGSFTETLINSEGCDSLVVLNLEILESTSSNLDITTCVSYTFPSGSTSVTENGIYTDTISNSFGCDSIITLNVTFDNFSSIENVSSCETEEYYWPITGDLIDSTGSYEALFQTAEGCDSSYFLEFTLIETTFGFQNIESCESFTLPSGNETYFTSGVYFDTLATDAFSCDSIIEFNVTILNSSESEITENACFEYTSPSGEIYTSSGIYTDIIPNSQGCDSTITIDLSITSFNPEISFVDSALFATTDNADYQWIDCNNGSIILGADEQYFVPITSGLYGVEVTLNGCTAISDCEQVTIIGIDELEPLNTFIFYPNPAKTDIFFDKIIDIQILDLNGRVIKQVFNCLSVNLSDLSSGIYYIQNQDGQVKKLLIY